MQLEIVLKGFSQQTIENLEVGTTFFLDNDYYIFTNYYDCANEKNIALNLRTFDLKSFDDGTLVKPCMAKLEIDD